MTSDGPYVAVVDDEASVRTALGRLLRLADYEVAAFASGGAFLASLATRRPDCAIIDIHMDGLSGFETKAQLTAAHGNVPVVFITASDDAGLDRIGRRSRRSNAAAQAFFERRARRSSGCGPWAQAVRIVMKASRGSHCGGGVTAVATCN